MTTADFGTIYSYPKNPRSSKALIAAKYNGLSVKEVTVKIGEETTQSAEFVAKFPLGKVPAFEGADGFLLYESTAIAEYVANAKEGTQLFGKDKKEAALVQQFIFFAENEFSNVVANWIYPILGYFPNNEVATTKAKADCKRALAVLNTTLATKTFLVGERVTLADIITVCSIVRLYVHVLDPNFVGAYKNVTRWFTTCINQPEFSSVLGPVELCQKMQVAPKPAAAPKEKKAEKAPAPKKVEAEEEEDLEAIAAAEQKPQGKNPLDLLPKSSLVLDDWKRFYSNNDTRPAAIDWFWANFDKEGYSIWKVEYKYQSELTMCFMSSNLIGGFYQRLERARKYAFGSMLVTGADNANFISGVFVFRGHGIPFEVSDAADYDSYKFTRMDESSEKDRELFNAYIAWEKIDGLECVDGKVFK